MTGPGAGTTRDVDDDADDLPYRDCAGAVLLNADGRVFVGKRLAEPGETLTHHWQMPQGGLDPGESAEAAARRELREEAGVRTVELLREMPGWIAYDLPPEIRGNAWRGGYRGQRQKWFCYRFLGPVEEIDLAAHGKPEFAAWRWVAFADLAKLVVPFKRPAYRSIVAAFRDLGG